jgi:hypothetical protein
VLHRPQEGNIFWPCSRGLSSAEGLLLVYQETIRKEVSEAMNRLKDKNKKRIEGEVEGWTDKARADVIAPGREYYEVGTRNNVDDVRIGLRHHGRFCDGNAVEEKYEIARVSGTMFWLCSTVGYPVNSYRTDDKSYDNAKILPFGPLGCGKLIILAPS